MITSFTIRVPFNDSSTSDILTFKNTNLPNKHRLENTASGSSLWITMARNYRRPICPRWRSSTSGQRSMRFDRWSARAASTARSRTGSCGVSSSSATRATSSRYTLASTRHTGLPGLTAFLIRERANRSRSACSLPTLSIHFIFLPKGNKTTICHQTYFF